MMRKLIILVLSVMILAIAGCVNPMEKINTTASQAKLPVLDGPWSITLNQSGGLMGLSRNLIITSEREAILFDQKKLSYQPTTLEKVRFENFLAQYQDVVVKNNSEKQDCADCFLYELSIDTGETKLKFAYNDIEAGANGLSALTQLMVGLMDEVSKK